LEPRRRALSLMEWKPAYNCLSVEEFSTAAPNEPKATTSGSTGGQSVREGRLPCAPRHPDHCRPNLTGRDVIPVRPTTFRTLQRFSAARPGSRRQRSAGRKCIFETDKHGQRCEVGTGTGHPRRAFAEIVEILSPIGPNATITYIQLPDYKQSAIRACAKSCASSCRRNRPPHSINRRQPATGGPVDRESAGPRPRPAAQNRSPGLSRLSAVIAVSPPAGNS